MQGVDVKDELARVRAENIELRARNAALERLADTDTLTPLPNRRAFVREVERVVASVARHATPAAILFLDVDALKAINDSWGHGSGDAALCHVAKILRHEVRASDIVARIGGDEFGLILDHLDEDAARSKGATLAAAVAAAPLVLDQISVKIGLSLGLAMVTPDTSVAELLARADRDMYRAKDAQRSAR